MGKPPLTKSRKRKHLLCFPKNPTVTAAALLALVFENDQIVQGSIRIGHIAAVTKEKGVRTKACRLKKSLTGSGLNADPWGDRPTPFAHFDASVYTFCANHALPVAFANKACKLVRLCVEGVWLGGRQPSNAQGGVLYYLLERAQQENKGDEWDLPAKHKRRVRGEVDPLTMADIVCEHLNLNKRTVVQCSSVIAARVSSSSTTLSASPISSSVSSSTVTMGGGEGVLVG